MQSFCFVCLITIIACGYLIIGSESEECNKLSFGYDSFVCVCNEESCDNIGQVPPPELGFYNLITTSRDEFRFDIQSLPLRASNSTAAEVLGFVNLSDVRQTMIGFGGAFTDAAGINIVSLSQQNQDTLLRQYFSPDGLEYNVGRIPIAGCDFSTHPYSYDDVEGDVELANFNLTEEDYLYKIPLILRAQEMSERPINLFASPWSPPSWMKTNGMFNGSGGLLPEMRQPWANYFIKFLEAYEEEGVTLWGLTAQNEPFGGRSEWKWNACHFTAEEQRDFVRDYLGPALNCSSYRDLKLMIADDSRYIFPEFPVTVLDDPEANEYISGVGVHWYADGVLPVSLVTRVHNLHPEKFILYTEACAGIFPDPGDDVELGHWIRAQKYASDIIENTNHWSSGWTDWNLALDMNGGPNWASNFVDSAIIVNEEANEFYKQPMFYVMGHFSKFIESGSLSVGSSTKVLSDNGTISDEDIGTSSFIDNSGRIIVVILNKFKESVVYHLEDSNGNQLPLNLPPKSLQTVLYNP